ncbi:MAG: hypothetical protein HY287_01040 [Planctomycetes bacterium]|nr:hypothetical protein [Planctomycetota bacterium]
MTGNHARRNWAAEANLQIWRFVSGKMIPPQGAWGPVSRRQGCIRRYVILAAEAMVAAGIRGILNFAPVTLHVGADVAVASVDLLVQLEQLSFQIAGQG